MSDLETGPSLGDWGMPNPMYNHDTQEYETHGMVWQGDENATKEDIEFIRAEMGENVPIDWPTCFGGESYWDRHKGEEPYKQHIVL